MAARRGSTSVALAGLKTVCRGSFTSSIRETRSTARRVFAIAQDGGSAIITKDAGKTWTKCKGAEGLGHPHGGTGHFSDRQHAFRGRFCWSKGRRRLSQPRSRRQLEKVADGQEAVVWGSEKNVYTMYGWACASCTNKGANYQVAPAPGDVGTWAKVEIPDALNWGPNSVATTTDGTHTIFIGSMWSTGLWRFVEP